MSKNNRKFGFPVALLLIALAVALLASCAKGPAVDPKQQEEEQRRQEALAAATQSAESYFAEYNATLIKRGYGGIKDGELYSEGGFFFVYENSAAKNISGEDYTRLLSEKPVIKNIIFLIPDGAGFGSYDYANAYKTKYAATATDGIVDGIKDTETTYMGTTLTTNRIEGMEVYSLYLDQFMIAHADTSMTHMAGHSATDSAAAGTALLCGTKTDYTMTGMKADFSPVANILEASRLDGKSTGFVTTKCLVDATPSAGTVHVMRRPDQDSCAYQEDASHQLLNSLIDVELCYGSDGGYVKAASKYSDKLIINDDRAENHGYTVVTDVETLEKAVKSGATKLFSKFQLNYAEMIDAGKDLSKTNYNMGTNAWDTDYQGHHILYDVDAEAGKDLTLMDLAKAALEVLDKNIANPNGFCLVIEGGAIDNAAEQRYAKEAVGDYLAFDEVFGYCVNFAMKRGDTIVVACPDHDSGGFYNPETQSEAPNKGNKAGKAFTDIDAFCEALHDGLVADNTVVGGQVTGHSPQDVPVWLYAPDSVRAEILSRLGLPGDASTEKVREGKFYDGTVLNDNYKINNSDIAEAVVEAARITKLDIATKKLFNPVYDNNDPEKYSFGTYDEETGVFTFANGAKVTRNSRTFVDASGNEHTINCGLPIYITNPAAYHYEDGSDKTAKKGKACAVFYVPEEVLDVIGYNAEEGGN